MKSHTPVKSMASAEAFDAGDRCNRLRKSVSSAGLHLCVFRKRNLSGHRVITHDVMNDYNGLELVHLTRFLSPKIKINIK